MITIREAIRQTDSVARNPGNRKTDLSSLFEATVEDGKLVMFDSTATGRPALIINADGRHVRVVLSRGEIRKLLDLYLGDAA